MHLADFFAFKHPGYSRAGGHPRPTLVAVLFLGNLAPLVRTTKVPRRIQLTIARLCGKAFIWRIAPSSIHAAKEKLYVLSSEAAQKKPKPNLPVLAKEF